MIETDLAEFSQVSELDPTAMAVLRLSLLDWCAVAYAGRQTPVARILRSQAEEEGGTPQANVIGLSQRVPARMAAFVNGTISHALDYDDTHFAHIGHPSVAVIPAALAVGQVTGASGQSVSEAALIGAEASIRVGLWLGRTHYQAGFHQTATAGAFGACLAACRLLSLSIAQTEMALGLVSTRASGLKSQFGTMGKPLNAGLAASNGVEAAYLASKGFVSTPHGLSTRQGFGATHHAEADVTALKDLGTRWRFETVSHKFHACCHGLHAMIEALSQIPDGDPCDIERIDVFTHPRWMSVCNDTHPTTGLEAKFSYRLVAAMHLLGHDTRVPESYSDAVCKDAKVLALRDRVEVTADAALSETQARVQVVLQSGQVKTSTYDLARPWSLDDREQRVLNKAQALLGTRRADDLWYAVQDGSGPDVLLAHLNA